MIDIKIHEGTVSTVNEFLVSNEQFGDDWGEEKTGLNDLLAEVVRLNAYIASIFDGGMLDIETYEEYKERIE